MRCEPGLCDQEGMVSGDPKATLYSSHNAKEVNDDILNNEFLLVSRIGYGYNSQKGVQQHINKIQNKLNEKSQQNFEQDRTIFDLKEEIQRLQ